jgi:anti-anti-sigma regulatory factor
MGLQNATITRISSGVVRTTHLTGVLTDLGSESVQLAIWLRDRRRDPKAGKARAGFAALGAHPTARRLALLTSIVGSFIFGSAVGTVGFDHFPRLCMVPPVVFLLWIIWQDLRTPICEIEPMDVAGDQDLGLPPGLAVYHLRRHTDRPKELHRLPDLLRWCERLPASERVVVLDLSEATTLDDNAALELRALIHQARARGRKLIFAGMTGRQYRAIIEAGAGDTLDPQNVCPDLELAIARGINALEH